MRWSKMKENRTSCRSAAANPTVHPQFFEVLDLAKSKPIKHLMVNTNGVRIAKDPEFARRLADYMPGFEIYLQFDSLEEQPLRELRGEDLRAVREQAIARLNEYNISTTLVVTLKKGLNDHEIGRILRYGIRQKAVRGVTFQPVQAAGRTENFDPARDRLTLSEVRQGIIEQSDVFGEKDILPVPCHPDCLAMGYALKTGDSAVPLTGMIDPQMLLQGKRNTIVFERDEELKKQVLEWYSLGRTPEGAGARLKELLCCLPAVSVPGDIGYDRVFRVIIMRFMDAFDMDVRSVKKSCVHIVHPDGRIIPFDTYNLFYRDGREEMLETIRAERSGEG